MAVFLLIFAIITFPNSWYSITVSMLYGFEKTRTFYTVFFSIAIISTIFSFTYLFINIRNRLSKFQVWIIFFPVLFTILYSYFNVTNYLVLHYIFTISAILSVFALQIGFSMPPLIQGKHLRKISNIIIVLEVLVIFISYLLFKDFILPMELLCIIVMSIWFYFAIKIEGEENRLTNTTKKGTM